MRPWRSGTDIDRYDPKRTDHSRDSVREDAERGRVRERETEISASLLINLFARALNKFAPKKNSNLDWISFLYSQYPRSNSDTLVRDEKL